MIDDDVVASNHVTINVDNIESLGNGISQTIPPNVLEHSDISSDIYIEAIDDAENSMELMGGKFMRLDLYEKICSLPFDKRGPRHLKFISDALRKFSFLGIMDEESCIELARTVTVQTFPSQSIIFAEGEVGDAFYMILEGRVSIHIKSRKCPNRIHPPPPPCAPDGSTYIPPCSCPDLPLECVSSLESGQDFGDVALTSIGNPIRSATVMTETTTRLFVIKKESFLTTNASSLTVPLLRARVSFLRQIDVLKDVSQGALLQLAKVLRPRKLVNPLEPLLLQGTQTDAVYFIRKGRLKMVSVLDANDPNYDPSLPPTVPTFFERLKLAQEDSINPEAAQHNLWRELLPLLKMSKRADALASRGISEGDALAFLDDHLSRSFRDKTEESDSKSPPASPRHFLPFSPSTSKTTKQNSINNINIKNTKLKIEIDNNTNIDSDDSDADQILSNAVSPVSPKAQAAFNKKTPSQKKSQEARWVALEAGFLLPTDVYGCLEVLNRSRGQVTLLPSPSAEIYELSEDALVRHLSQEIIVALLGKSPGGRFHDLLSGPRNFLEKSRQARKWELVGLGLHDGLDASRMRNLKINGMDITSKDQIAMWMSRTIGPGGIGAWKRQEATVKKVLEVSKKAADRKRGLNKNASSLQQSSFFQKSDVLEGEVKEKDDAVSGRLALSTLVPTHALKFAVASPDEPIPAPGSARLRFLNFDCLNQDSIETNSKIKKSQKFSHASQGNNISRLVGPTPLNTNDNPGGNYPAEVDPTAELAQLKLLPESQRAARLEELLALQAESNEKNTHNVDKPLPDGWVTGQVKLGVDSAAHMIGGYLSDADTTCIINAANRVSTICSGARHIVLPTFSNADLLKSLVASGADQRRTLMRLLAEDKRAFLMRQELIHRKINKSRESECVFTKDAYSSQGIPIQERTSMLLSPRERNMRLSDNDFSSPSARLEQNDMRETNREKNQKKHMNYESMEGARILTRPWILDQEKKKESRQLLEKNLKEKYGETWTMYLENAIRHENEELKKENERKELILQQQQQQLDGKKHQKLFQKIINHETVLVTPVKGITLDEKGENTRSMLNHLEETNKETIIDGHSISLQINQMDLSAGSELNLNSTHLFDKDKSSTPPNANTKLSFLIPDQQYQQHRKSKLSKLSDSWHVRRRKSIVAPVTSISNSITLSSNQTNSNNNRVHKNTLSPPKKTSISPAAPEVFLPILPTSKTGYLPSNFLAPSGSHVAQKVKNRANEMLGTKVQDITQLTSPL